MSIKKVLAIICFATAILLIEGLVEITYAKYISRISVYGNADVAVPITNDSTNETLTFQLDNILPGDRKIYNFSVTNFILDDVTDTKMIYTISIVKSNNIPADIILYKNGVNTNVLNSDLISIDNILTITDKVTDTYQLVVDWNENIDDYIYNGLTDYLDVVIESVQVIE